MKNVFRILVFLFLLVACREIVFAQGAVVDIESESKNTTPSKPIIVARVEIQNAKIISKDNNNLKLSFDIFNGEKIQSDIKYAVQLVQKTENSQTIKDEQLYGEAVNLNENQKISKDIVYNAPNYIKGSFSVQVVVKNDSGLILSLVNVGDVEFSGDGRYIEILQNSCYLQVDGKGDKKYSLSEGVDISADEKIIGFCDIINNFDTEKQFDLKFTTYWRSDFGREVETKNETLEKIMLKAKEKKQISFVLPKPSLPQAYDTQLKFMDSQGNTISNSVKFHYVIAGSSATIQNLRLDKNYYKEGETAKVSLFWSGSANSSPFSRIKLAKEDNFFVKINIKNKDGKNCMDEFRKEINVTKSVADLALPIASDCYGLQVEASIQDASGHILDKKELSMESPNISVEKEKCSFKEIGLLVVGFLFLISLVLIFCKRKKQGMALLFIFVSSGMFFCNAYFAKAETSLSSYYIDVVNPFGIIDVYDPLVFMSYSIDKSVYAPGEPITGNVSSLFSAICMNTFGDYKIFMKFYEDQPWFEISNSMPAVVSSNVPNIPGTYEAYFSFRDMRCYSGNAFCPYDEEIFINNKLVALNGAEGALTPDAWKNKIATDLGMTPRDYFDAYASSQGISGCVFGCSGNTKYFTIPYTVDGPMPPPPPELPCEGSVPAGYNKCPGDDLGSPVSWTDVGSVSSCSAAKCEYYEPQCQGSIPVGPYAKCPGDGGDSSLGWDLVYPPNVCSPARDCEYYPTSCVESCGTWSECEPSCGPGGQRKRDCIESDCTMTVETQSASCNAVCPIKTEMKEVK